jgi:hypothetical protein
MVLRVAVHGAKSLAAQRVRAELALPPPRLSSPSTTNRYGDRDFSSTEILLKSSNFRFCVFPFWF